jgi:hypothetical protein
MQDCGAILEAEGRSSSPQQADGPQAERSFLEEGERKAFG